MLFSDIIGLEHIKNHLTASADKGRIPHAQLFVGSNGSGTLPMAIAYAQYILCGNENNENQNGNAACNRVCNQLEHPDLHFAFPVNKTGKGKPEKPVSNDFITEWRELVLSNPYASLFDWYKHLGIENKQGNISVHETAEILHALSLKPHERGFKVMIVWRAERMKPQASNKLLKLIEEPPEKTLLILIAEEENQLLQTIRSRCQVLHFPPLGEAVIAKALKEKTDAASAALIARQANGNYTNALHILSESGNEEQFETWFVTWVRAAFKAKGNKASVRDLIAWSEEIAASIRETQKRFLLYCMDFFRQALLYNYQAKDLVYLAPKTKGFSMEKFAPFVHGNNISQITQELQDAIFHIERNGNAKIIFTDLSIKLTRFMHMKA